LALDLLFEIFDQTLQMFQISAPWFSDVIPGFPVGLFVATLDLEHANLISSANHYLPPKTEPNSTSRNTSNLHQKIIS
jgi:hypothetical protein